MLLQFVKNSTKKIKSESSTSVGFTQVAKNQDCLLDSSYINKLKIQDNFKRQRIERSYYCPKPTHWEKFSLVVPELIKHLDGPGPAVPGVVSEEVRDQVVEDVLQTQDGNSGVSGQALSIA